MLKKCVKKLDSYIKMGVVNKNGQNFLINGQNFLYFCPKISNKVVKIFYNFGFKILVRTNLYN